MKKFFYELTKKFLNQPELSVRASGRPQSGLEFQKLENRALLAGITFNSGIVTVEGTNNADNISAVVDGLNIKFTLNATTQSFAANTVLLINLFGEGGNDTLANSTDKPSIMRGGLGNDVMTGGSVADRMEGGDGDDTLTGGAGADDILGEVGNDTLNGGDGDDLLTGGDGNDF
ncbi:MAG: calcium-binding protein, partial [Planctomycetota bacterium]